MSRFRGPLSSLQHFSDFSQAAKTAKGRQMLCFLVLKLVLLGGLDGKKLGPIPSLDLLIFQTCSLERQLGCGWFRRGLRPAFGRRWWLVSSVPRRRRLRVVG